MLQNKNQNASAAHELINRIIDGDKKALQRIYKVTNRKVATYLNRFLLDAKLVEYVLIDTYSRIWEEAGSCPERGSVLVWILSIAREIAYECLDRTGQTGEWQKDGQAKSNVHPLNSAAHGSASKTALQSLSLEDREYLALVLSPGISYQHIAELMQIPVYTAKTEVFHAKAQYSQRLKELGSKL